MVLEGMLHQYSPDPGAGVVMVLEECQIMLVLT